MLLAQGSESILSVPVTPRIDVDLDSLRFICLELPVSGHMQ